MLTNGTAEAEQYYRIKFRHLPYDHFEYGKDALSAISTAREDFADCGNVGNATARPAVYGEWDCAPHHFHNDGTHSHDYKLEA